MGQPAKVCENCKYWEKMERYNNGRCRINPPTVFANGISTNTHWPKTKPEDWCGRFEYLENLTSRQEVDDFVLRPKNGEHSS